MQREREGIVEKMGFHKRVLVRLSISILVLGLVFRLFSSNSTEFARVSEVSYTDHSSIEKLGKCDIFVGDWVYSPEGPRYTNETCGRVEDHQNCMKNGRPDSDYLYWRWKPRDCDVPVLDD